MTELLSSFGLLGAFLALSCASYPAQPICDVNSVRSLPFFVGVYARLSYSSGILWVAGQLAYFVHAHVLVPI